jgi:hypothetical protein
MSDKIIPFRKPQQEPAPTENLAETLAHLPDEAPILIQFVVTESPSR